MILLWRGGQDWIFFVLLLMISTQKNETTTTTKNNIVHPRHPTKKQADG